MVVGGSVPGRTDSGAARQFDFPRAFAHGDKMTRSTNHVGSGDETCETITRTT